MAQIPVVYIGQMLNSSPEALNAEWPDVITINNNPNVRLMRLANYEAVMVDTIHRLFELREVALAERNKQATKPPPPPAPAGD